MKRSFNSLMEQYRILIWNAEDPAIKAMIEPFGYTTEKISEGKTLFEEVEALAKKQQKEYAEQYIVSTAFIEKKEDAMQTLNELRKFAKFIFKNDNSAYKTLNLDGSLPLNFADWLQEARHFYEELHGNNELITAMEPFNVTPESVSANLTRLDALKSLQEQRKRETGDAQDSTQERNEKFDQLKGWCSTLRELVKILFEEENAQYLEKLGILVRS